jgi:hypothetical protein
MQANGEIPFDGSIEKFETIQYSGYNSNAFGCFLYSSHGYTKSRCHDIVVNDYFTNKGYSPEMKLYIRDLHRKNLVKELPRLQYMLDKLLEENKIEHRIVLARTNSKITLRVMFDQDYWTSSKTKLYIILKYLRMIYNQKEYNLENIVNNFINGWERDRFVVVKHKNTVIKCLRNINNMKGNSFIDDYFLTLQK